MLQKPIRRSLIQDGRIILAEGEVTGHAHEVVAREEGTDIPFADFFEEPDGRRLLLVLAPCLVRHQEHAQIALDPKAPHQVRQGDVLLTPVGPVGSGVWEVTRQVEYTPQAVRQVAD